MNIYQSILQGLSEQDVLDWLALLFGLAYVILIAKGKWIGWWFGIISCGIILWKDITSYSIWADAGLQFFYIVMGIIGLWRWRFKTGESDGFTPAEWPFRRHLLVLIIGVFVSYILGQFLSSTRAALPFVDSLTSVFAVIATWLMVSKVRSNWLYWILIDAAYVFIYLRQGAYYFALLSLIYLILAVYGFYAWKKYPGVQSHTSLNIS